MCSNAVYVFQLCKSQRYCKVQHFKVGEGWENSCFIPKSVCFGLVVLW